MFLSYLNILFYIQSECVVFGTAQSKTMPFSKIKDRLEPTWPALSLSEPGVSKWNLDIYDWNVLIFFVYFFFYMQMYNILWQKDFLGLILYFIVLALVYLGLKKLLLIWLLSRCNSLTIRVPIFFLLFKNQEIKKFLHTCVGVCLKLVTFFHWNEFNFY